MNRSKDSSCLEALCSLSCHKSLHSSQPDSLTRGLCSESNKMENVFFMSYKRKPKRTTLFFNFFFYNHVSCFRLLLGKVKDEGFFCVVFLFYLLIFHALTIVANFDILTWAKYITPWLNAPPPVKNS